MTAITGIMLMYAVFGSAVWMLSVKESLNKPIKKGDTNIYITVALVLGAVIRIFAATTYRGHNTDMSCFIGWSDTIFKNGLSQFYISEGFHDYPPGYVYVMYLLGAVKNIFMLDGGALWLWIKTPSIIADLLAGYFVYSVAEKRYNKAASVWLGTLVILNPAVILNSSLWGQVDSILGILCVVCVYCASEKQLIKSFFMFALAFLVKPQAVFVAPVLVFAIVEQAILTDDYSTKKLIKILLGAVGAILSMLVLFMPFGLNPIHGIEVIINQYIQTVKQYNYMTVNAFNLYGAMGKNWADAGGVISLLGYASIAAVWAYAAFVFFRSKNEAKYYITSFILIFGVYMFSVKMHERYAFPALFILAMVLVYAPKTKNFAAYGLMTLSQFFNIAWVLFVYETDPNKYFRSPVIVVASVINIIIFAALVYMFREKGNPALHTKKEVVLAPPVKEKPIKLSGGDFVAITIITLVYALVAFYNLGNRYAPQTFARLTDNKVTVDLGSETDISNTAFFLGARQLEQDRNITFSYKDERRRTVYEDIITDGSVFCWNTSEKLDVRARYIDISSNAQENPNDFSEAVYLNEVCFTDAGGDIITPTDTEGTDAALLFDEQAYLINEKSYMTGTYFDEIYHARTAYEFIHNMSIYEWTHPPLGKLMISVGISIFGMVPFGWRFIGTLMGVVMVAVMYLLARRMLRYRWLSVCVCLLFTFDFMHFAQTRIATIDTYVTLFIMLMYYFMYKYSTENSDAPIYKKLIALGISGIFFGLSVAAKWTGLYAGAGLAAVFFISLYNKYRHDFALYKKEIITTLSFCVIAFVAVPALIYVISYIPYIDTPGADGIGIVFKNAADMLTYHGKTVVDSTHPYSSHWYEWPIMYRPIWYFSNTLDNGLKQGISSFGNPAVWWVGILAVAYNLAVAIIIPSRNRGYYGKGKGFVAVIYTAVFALLCAASVLAASANEKLQRLPECMLLYSVIFVGIFMAVLSKDTRFKQINPSVAIFLTIGYFSCLLPWTLVVRTTYIYHYFPCVVFSVLMIGYAVKTIYENLENKKLVIISAVIYTGVAIGLFVLFYPVLSGTPVSLEFAEKWLKWFGSWVLVA